MREFIPTHLISAGTSGPRPLPATDAPPGNHSVVRLDESHSTVQDILAGTFADAVMVLSAAVSAAFAAHPLKSIVLELMAMDFISRWDKSRMSFTFDDWLARRAHDRCGRRRDQRRGHGESSPPFGLSLFALGIWSRQCRVELRATVGQIGGGSA